MDITTFGKTGYRLKGKNSLVQVEKGVVLIGTEKPFKIDAPGEYEVGGTSVIGISDAAGGKIYVIEMDALRVGMLEGVAGKLTEKQIEEMGPVDIVVLPALQTEVVQQIDPWVIIVEKGVDTATVTPKYSVTMERLPTETQTVVLERKA